MAASIVNLLPLAELTPGQVGAIRNSVIDSLVKQASQELRLSPDSLIVRDVLPVTDLAWYTTPGTAATVQDWVYNATTTSAAFVSVTGTAAMADQRYVALYGVRDLRVGLMATGPGGASATAAVTLGEVAAAVSLVKINVGGSDKVIWDIKNMEAYPRWASAFAPTAVVIPQNASYNISLYKMDSAAGQKPIFLQMIGVTVEPRGKVISP